MNLATSTPSSSIVLRKHEILDSRSKYNTGPGKYEYVDSFGIQFESSKKTHPIIAFGKGKGINIGSLPEDTIIPHATKYDSMKALDKLLKQNSSDSRKGKYKARLRKARITKEINLILRPIKKSSLKLKKANGIHAGVSR